MDVIVEVVVFLVISLALNAVSGISMCKGPFRPPELISATEEPVYNYRNELQRLKVRLVVKSTNPVFVRWMTHGTAYEPGEEASPENADFRSSVYKEDNNQVFVMDMKTEEGNITDLLREIHVTLDVNFGCNTVDYDMTLKNLREITSARWKLVTMTEVPQGRYLTADSDEGPFNITLGFTFGPSRKPPRVSTTCLQYLVRKNGNLTTHDMTGPSGYHLYRSSENENKDLGVTDTTCEVDFPKDVESLHVTIYSQVRFVDENDIAPESFDINMNFELRRNGVTKPAILLRVWYGPRPTWIDGVLTVATNRDNVQLACLADAERKPYEALAKIHADGRYEVLPRLISSLENPYQSVGFSRFKVTSPVLSTSDEYICSAARGSTVISQRFRLMRYGDVTIDGAGESPVVMKTTTNSPYVFTCAAKGFPQPKIRFYWTPDYQYTGVNSEYYIKANKDHEIEETDYIKTAVTVKGDTTKGRVIVVDFKKIMDGQPVDFWNRYYRYVITCYAYNDFSTTSKELADYDRTYDTIVNQTMSYSP